LSKLETAGRFFDNLTKLGYDERKALHQLSTISNLETEIKQLGEKRDNLKKTFEQEEQNLAQLQKDVVDTSNTLSQVNEAKNQAAIAWVHLSEKIKQKSYRIEFAEALCQLFEERVILSPQQMMQLLAELQRIYVTAFKHAGYAIDYSQARATVISLLESAIGKGVVPQEQYDKAVKQHDDLMLDKLGKMEREHNELVELRAKLGENIIENGIAAAVFIETKGFVKKYICPKCKTFIAHSALNTSHILTPCPFCNAILQPKPDSSPQQP